MKSFNAWAVRYPGEKTNIRFLPTNEPRIYTEKSHALYYAGGNKKDIVRVRVSEIKKRRKP